MTRLLVLSGTASAINYIHALKGTPGLELFVTDANRYCPGLYVEGVRPLLVPRARDRDAYREALDRIIATHRIDALIPTSDYDIEGVVSLLDAGWNPPVRMYRPTLAQLSNLADKAKLIEALSRKLPAHVPRTWRPPLPPIEDFRFPVVAKPLGESGGKGVAIAHDASQLKGAVERLERAHGTNFIVQEFIPGGTWVLTMIYDNDGRYAVGVAMRSHLTFFTWGGGGCAGELMDAPEVLALGQRIIAAAGGWKGPINMELRQHTETGVWYVFEVNCRLNGYSYLTTMNGLDLPAIAVAVLEGREPPRLQPNPVAQWRNFVLGFRETPVDAWVEGG